jgi:probable HAF family extracellular repeat protein
MQRNFYIALIPATMLAMVIAANAQVGKVTCTYTSFKVLQGSQPGVGGINDSDWVSGSAQTGKPMTVGFIRKPNGTVTSFLINGHPNLAQKINNYGSVVGSYFPDPGSGNQLGYKRYSNGAVLTLNGPSGARSTTPYGINNAGKIVGAYVTTTSVQKGFTYLNGAYTTFYHSGWSFMEPQAINKQGVIVGSYTDSSSKVHGFAYSNGQWVTVNVPGASNTAIVGINDWGSMVGWYLPTGSSTSRGFLYKNGKFSTVEYAGKPSFSVDGINNLGHIYGDGNGSSFIGKACHSY